MTATNRISESDDLLIFRRAKRYFIEIYDAILVKR